MASGGHTLDDASAAIQRGGARTGRDLVAAVKPFAQEVRARSWWFVWSTLALVLGVLTIAALAPWWPARRAASLAGGLLMVRCFIL